MLSVNGVSVGGVSVYGVSVYDVGGRWLTLSMVPQEGGDGGVTGGAGKKILADYFPSAILPLNTKCKLLPPPRQRAYIMDTEARREIRQPSSMRVYLFLSL